MTGFGAIVFSGKSWLVPALGAVAGLALALLWSWRRNPAERWVPLVCGGCKLAGVIALALCLLEPLRVTQRARPGANSFAIIADNSQSLQIKDQGQTKSRGEVLRDELTADPRRWQTQLEENFQVRRYTFDSRLQSVRDFAELNFDGRSSALGASLRAAAERWRGQPVAGVLLFTDGNATDLAGDAALPPDCPPIYPVVLGSDAGLSDISLDRVTVSQTAFEDAPVTAQASVTARGFGGSNVVAELTEVAAQTVSFGANEAVPRVTNFSSAPKSIASQTQRSDGETSELNFRFQFQPAKPGLHFYKLEARAADELKTPNAPTREATLVNNSRMIVVDRGQEPLRVLCVSGRPDWEYKYLNRALDEDSQVRMVTLMRVAPRRPKFAFKDRFGEGVNPLYGGFNEATNDSTPGYDQPVVLRLNTKDEFELRGDFPKDAKELFQYDAVIVDRVEASYFTHEQMLLLHRFVSERGGGFLMLGGAETFLEGGYAETAIGSMLPVYLDRPANVELPSVFKYSLTREGWLQPWVRLRSTESDEQQRLSAMPAFEVLNPIRQSRPGASVLATVSDPKGREYPALVTQRFGLGSVAALMIGDMWRWGLQDETSQKDLAKSWRQLVRWLVADVPSRFAVTIQPTEDTTQVKLLVKARDEEFKPLDDVNVKLTIQPVCLTAPAPGESNAPNSAGITNTIELSAEPSATDPGVYQATYVVRQAGGYAVNAVVTRPDNTVAGRAAAGWTSDPAAEEFQTLKPNRALLEGLARRTGGQMVAMDDLRQFIKGLPNRNAPITDTVSEPLWHQPAVFLFALCCFLADWGLRRLKGLP